MCFTEPEMKFINDKHHHRIIIRTEIACMGIFCYVRDSACTLFIVKKATAKIF